MCLNFGTISNTTINADGHSVTFRSNSLSPFGTYSSFGSFSPGCFGYGFAPMCNNNPFLFGAGAGIGMAVGMMLPDIFKGIGKACSWGFNNLVKPAFNFVGKGAQFVWNKAIVPAAKGVWSAVKWAGNGIKNLWNKIF